MNKNTEVSNTQYWEVPEIDLNLSHYSGNHCDVIKNIKMQIEKYLNNPEVSEENRKIYSALYNALCYYNDLSYLPSPEFKVNDTFLSKCLRSFNTDYLYLSSKYNSKDPSQPPVITYVGRVKSLISFIDKVKGKITEYLDEGRNLSYLNESLRDIIGIRVIVNPPKDIVSQGPQAESDFLYKVYYDLMLHRGLSKNNLEGPIYSFLPINTRFHPRKSEEIRNRPKIEGFSSSLNNDHIYIPTSKPKIDEEETINLILKDYNMYPKFSGYQSLHTCVKHAYSDYVEHSTLPKFIIPPASYDYSFEYQFRTKKQNEFAEHGIASHSLFYKNNMGYHRLRVPIYISTNPTNASYNNQENIRDQLSTRNFGESFEMFYGCPFESYFGISFQELSNIFTSYDRDEILARRKNVVFDKEQNRYILDESDSRTAYPSIIIVSKDELETLKAILSSNDKENLLQFLKGHLLTDYSSQSSSSSNDVPGIHSLSNCQIYISDKDTTILERDITYDTDSVISFED